MSTELIINASLPETRISLMESGEIQELLIERAQGKGIVGNIYKGRVTRVLPGMQAAFVDIGLEKAAFLYVDDVYTHSEIWETEEETSREGVAEEGEAKTTRRPPKIVPVEAAEAAASGGEAGTPGDESQAGGSEAAAAADALPMPADSEAESHEDDDSDLDSDEDGDDVPGAPGDESQDGDEDEDDGSDDDLEAAAFESEFDDEDVDDEEDEDEDDRGPVGMGPGPKDGDDGDSRGGNAEQPAGTLAPQDRSSEGRESSESDAQAGGSAGEASSEEGIAVTGGETAEEVRKRRHRRGRRGGRNRKRGRDERGTEGVTQAAEGSSASSEGESVDYEDGDGGERDSDRTALTLEQEQGGGSPEEGAEAGASGRPVGAIAANGPGVLQQADKKASSRPEFREPRNRDRKIKAKPSSRPARGQAKIEDLLHEGQEVIVQVAKDPIATKGARLTCHISLPGRHLVCMPTIDHVGVSRRIENDSERRKLRDFVEKNRPKNLGFIVRTASGKSQAEKRIKQDIDYLTRLWSEIKEKAASVQAPAMIYEDLNSVLRAIRDWVSEDIDKIFVDSRYHYNEIQKFVSHFMPSLKQKVELYHGDVPIFDAYGISTELSRALERKVWLKSGGYIVIDQSEALVAIDVNTGRYVGKKNLEDTILKTNLEAVNEIAYQLRLRNCGGIIILDFIDMEKEENRQRVYRALEEALKKDRARPSILKISELGLVEMTRKRTRDTMVRALCESCSHCEGKGYVKSKTTVAYEIMRELEREGIDKDVNKILIQAHSDVIDVLAIDERDSMDQLERRYRKQIYLQSVGDYHQEQFEVVGERREGATREPIGAERGRDRGRGRDRDRGGKDREKSGDRDRSAQGGGQSEGGREGRGGGRDRGGRDGGRDRGRDRDRGGRDRGSRGDRPSIIMPASPEAQAARDARNAELERERQGGQQEGTGHEMPVSTPRVAGDESYTEEDRLAFLRAQAAQDAALAKLGGQAPAPGNRQNGAGIGGKRPGAQGAGGGQPRSGGDRGAQAGPGGEREGGRRRRRRGGRNRRDDRGPRGENREAGAPIQARDDSAPSGGGESGGNAGGAAPAGGGDSSHNPTS